MKQLTEAQLHRLGRWWGEVKLGEGSIRDAEFVAQYLQLAHGAQHPELRTGNTAAALARLAEAGLLTPADHRVLADGYTFLRTVEHTLQLLENRQTHTLPTDPAELRYLARRLGFTGEDAGSRFTAHYEQHSAAIREVYLRHLGPPDDSGAPTQRGVVAMDQTDVTGADRPQPSAINRHLARLAPSYASAFTAAEIAQHVQMAELLGDRNPVEVRVEPCGGGTWRVTVVAFDYLGELSVICGLLFAYGMSIVDGHVYTYEPQRGAGEEQAAAGAAGDARRRIVDVFTVRPTAGEPADMGALWRSYATDLAALLRLLHAHRQQEAQVELAKRLALAAGPAAPAGSALQPVEIEIDNDASDTYTILRISAADTIGFLYEISAALALSDVYISRVAVSSAGSRVQDTLFITNRRGQKISDPQRQRELRAATVLVKHFTHLLPLSPDPALALQHFHEFLGELFERPSWPDELASLERPEVLRALARLLGVSDFLWDDFLRMQHENLFPVVRDVAALAAGKSRKQLAGELDRLLRPESAGDDWRGELNAFKDREMFRIDMRHILGLIPAFAQFAGELTDLTEVIVEAAAHRCEGELAAAGGRPGSAGGAAPRWCVAALGKCGGREMGFASDVELMFVFDGTGETAGPRPVTAAEYYEKLVIEFLRSIRARREGIFEIDLALRPYGKASSLAVPLAGFSRYYGPGGAAWGYERQALVKLRVIAGDAGLGAEIEALRDEYVYGAAAFDVAAMRAMRERQLRHLVTPGTLNAKFSRGGLVDVEYIVQGLQIMHGAARPALRVTNTAEAIGRLINAGVLSLENGARLGEALVFLQQLINALRMVRGNNRDLTTPPEDSEEFAFLARRLGHGQEPGRLAAAISEQMAWVQRLGTQLLG